MAEARQQGRERRKQWVLAATIAVMVATLSLLVWREYQLKRPSQLYVTAAGTVDMCLSCHQEEKLDAAHDAKMLGCTPCHLGDPLAITADAAHRGMVVNPGDLRHADRTCSVEGCHPSDIHKVKNSLMATNRGILSTLLYYWGETPNQQADIRVDQLLTSDKTSLALDYYRKLCATCHLWKQKNDLPGVPEFFNAKGGGCTACHFQMPGETADVKKMLVGDQVASQKPEKKQHPQITAKVTTANCVRCHNRSGRIGLSYIGMFESEGYGTPYENGHLSSKQLPGARFYLDVADDIHHRSGMACIDCHTRNEIMGDGTSYGHYEEQLEITCESCHGTRLGITRKGEMLTNVVRNSGTAELVGKIDGKARPLHLPKPGVCDFRGHQRLSCESCHSTWVPQCNGCHVKRDMGATHLDKLSGQETAGQWQEGRSYIRYEKPMLGVWDDEIVVVTPGCQDIVTLLDAQGKLAGGFNRSTMAAINPHTTQAKGRSCVDCHASPKTVGLGEGTLFMKDGRMQFAGLDQGVATHAGQVVPFDAFVDLAGKARQKSSRPGLRPFNATELQAILQVGRCVGCHDQYDDPLWYQYKPGLSCPNPAGQKSGPAPRP